MASPSWFPFTYVSGPGIFHETLVEARLSASGEQFLLRTKEYDYEFSLPWTHIRDARLSSDGQQPRPLLTHEQGTAASRD